MEPSTDLLPSSSPDALLGAAPTDGALDEANTDLPGVSVRLPGLQRVKDFLAQFEETGDFQFVWLAEGQLRDVINTHQNR
jgi:hypothetical protein